MEKTDLNDYVYDFSVGYDDIEVENIRWRKIISHKMFSNRVNGFIKFNKRNSLSCKNTW